MPRLEFASYSPFHDIEGTVAKLKAKHPTISDHGINVAVKRMLDGYKPRHKGLVVHLYGADILTADLEDIPAWPWVSDAEKRRIQKYPIDKGERVPNDVDAEVRRMVQEEMAGRLSPWMIHRSVLISPPGLQQTYVWRQANDWIQEVTDADYALILSTPYNRRHFRDPDIHGPYVPVRSYDTPGEEIGRARSLRDAEYLMRHVTRRPQWSGTDVAD
jgi:hypothetical protein